MNSINRLDSMTRIMDIFAPVMQLSQRQDIRHALKQLWTMLKSLVIIMSLVISIVLWFCATAVRAVYDEWKASIPIVISACQTGYAEGGMEKSIIALLTLTKEITDAIETHPSQVMTTPLEITQPSKSKTETQRLRAACTAAGIKWRNTRGKNKHATVVQMRKLLQSVQPA